MTVRQYIGARYTIKVYENDSNNAEWTADTAYERLTLVTYQNSTYLSKADVSASIGNPADNPTFWVETGFYNGQIAALQSQITNITDNIIGDLDTLTTYNKNSIVSAANEIRSSIDYVTLYDYGYTADTTVSEVTTMLQSALDSGKPVNLLGMSLEINGTLTINTDNKIYNGSLTYPSGDVFYGNVCGRVWFIDLNIHDSANAFTGAFFFTTWININVDTMSDCGFKLTNESAASSLVENKFSNITIRHCTNTAFSVASGNKYTDAYLDECIIDTCNMGIDLETNAGWSISRVHIYGVTGTIAIKIRGGFRVNMSQIYIETGEINAELSTSVTISDSFITNLHCFNSGYIPYGAPSFLLSNCEVDGTVTSAGSATVSYSNCRFNGDLSGAALIRTKQVQEFHFTSGALHTFRFKHDMTDYPEIVVHVERVAGTTRTSGDIIFFWDGTTLNTQADTISGVTVGSAGYTPSTHIVSFDLTPSSGNGVLSIEY